MHDDQFVCSTQFLLAIVTTSSSVGCEDTGDSTVEITVIDQCTKVPVKAAACRQRDNVSAEVSYTETKLQLELVSKTRIIRRS